MNPLANFLAGFGRPPGYHRSRAGWTGDGHKEGRRGQQKKQIEQRRRQAKAAKKTRQAQRSRGR